jgi:ATP-binding cassette subfamily C protein
MKTNKVPLSLRAVGGVISKQAKFSIYRFAVARVAANLLDLVGLAGIALLASSFGAFATSGGSVAPLNIPVIGEVTINERVAVVIALAIAGTFLLKSAFSIFLNLKTSLFVATLEADFSKTLAKDYFMGGSEGELGFSDSLSEFQNVAMASAGALSSFITARIAAISEIALLIGMIGSFLFINPIAALAMFFYLGSVLWALSQFVTKRIRRNGLIQMEGSKTSLESSRDLFGVRREVRASGELTFWISKFAAGRAQSASSGAIVSTLNGLPRYVIETSLIFGIFAFLAGIVVLSDLPSQAVTIGVFMAGGLRVVASLLPLQASINTMINGANQGKFALERLKVIFDHANDHDRTTPVQYVSGQALGLHFDGVSFGYDAAMPVVKDISFDVKGGQKVAIVGPSGAGKTTTFELATGFRLPTSGVLVLDDTSPRELLEHGDGVIGIVPQRPHLVSGTLAENVSLASIEKTDLEKVASCLSIAGLSAFSSTEKLAMVIQPDSGQLSGGEIQRLGLARALYRNPGILFLDEATSALDAETESEINKVLDGLRGQMTIVLIAHRLSTVKNADKIIYMNNGVIVAEGTFKELQKKVPDFEKAVKLMGLDD